MLTCQHHIQWIRRVDGGLHQCILCQQVVTKKDVYPKLEDLPPEVMRRWDEHEATRPAPEADAPKVEAPKAEAPKAEAPKAEAPKAEAPKAEAPKAEAPKAAAH